LAIAVSSILFLSCKKTEVKVANEVSVVKKEVVAVAKLETATFNIEGMTCAIGCAKTIQEKLAAMDGVQKATVDFDKKTATVAFDATKQNPAKLLEAIETTGDGKTYTVSNMKS
jgi:copper chaperone CopZ